MKRTAVVLGTILTTLFALAAPSQAYEAGRRYGAFTYPNFSGRSMSISSWFNVDPANDKVRGYGYTNPPDYSGFRSSAQTDMRFYITGGSAVLSGNRIYGFTEQLTSSSYLMTCSGNGTDYWSVENWQTTDSYDYNYQGAFDSYVEFIAAGCG